mgnify:CR=1 FL=1
MSQAADLTQVPEAGSEPYDGLRLSGVTKSFGTFTAATDFAAVSRAVRSRAMSPAICRSSAATRCGPTSPITASAPSSSGEVSRSTRSPSWACAG